MQLQIRHIDSEWEGKLHFTVVHEGKQSKLISLKSPWENMIGQQSLLQGLQWYLEKYLELPIDNFKMRAEETLAMLSKWGRDCFDALFDSGGNAQNWYRDARHKDLSNLKLEIVSDDAAVLSWPWEVLESQHDGLLAQQCRIERRLDNIGDVRSSPKAFVKDRLNILYIIARPYGDNDVGVQTLARPLVDFVKDCGWPVYVDILRPPTFDKLRAVLEEKPHFYHIVHFDGHGGFDEHPSSGSAYTDSRNIQDKYARLTGQLIFEKGDIGQEADEIPASMLGELLRKHNIPVMVLNACQSAMHAADPFASVAVSLLHAGIRNVVAMSYSLWVSGAEVFVPAFYKQLFTTSDISGAIQAGRREMFRNHMRDTYYGKTLFHDWMVPVLYQQSTEDILPKLESGAARVSALPDESQYIGDYGFIGRDRAIRQLERAIRGKPAGILIHGMAGEGKTTLAKGFLHWLEATNGLGHGAFWFSFEDIHSAEYIINKLTSAFFGTDAMALRTDQNLTVVTQVLRENHFLIVWDGMESAFGIPGTEVSALLPEEDRAVLKKFLHDLRGGKTKVIITSRSTEPWLAPQECFRLPLSGLQGEELWRYCNAVVSDLGLTVNREDASYNRLMQMLAGNPLVVRAILLRLAEPGRTASQLAADLENGFKAADGVEEAKRIQAALSVFERGLDSDFAPVLRLLGMHEHFADVDLLSDMIEATGMDAPIDRCFDALERSGLCNQIGDSIYQLHPALRTYLTRIHPEKVSEQKAFIDVMGNLADAYAPKELHEQHYVFALFSANFLRALRLAEELDMQKRVLALTQALAVYSKNTHNLFDADRMFSQLAKAASNYNEAHCEAAAYHQLGIVAQERRDLNAAEGWYKKSMDISLKQGDEHGAASTYHQLGIVAQERRDLNAAEGWYKKSMDISLKQGNEHSAASTYHQLGIVAQERSDLNAAEGWYKKSLDISLKQGNEHSAASTYHQLGIVEEERRDLDAAENWYVKSLEISLKQGNEHSAASTYHQLGIVAQERSDLNAAEGWYMKSLDISLKQGNEHSAASTYHQLGIVEEERRDLDAAENWYMKSLEISLKQDDELGAARTYHQLGIVAEERRDLDAAENWYMKSLDIKLKQGDEHSAARTYHQLGIVAEKRRDLNAAEGWYMKSLEISLKQGDEHSAARTYHQLGIVAEERRDLNTAEGWYMKSLEISLKQGDEHGAASTYHQLGIVTQERRDLNAAEGWYMKSLEISLKQGNERGAAGTYHQLGNVAQERRDLNAAEGWYMNSLEISLKQGNERGVSLTYHQLGMVAQERRDFVAAEGWFMKSLDIKLKQGNEHGASRTYHQLGAVSEVRGDKNAAEAWYRKALVISLKQGDEHGAAYTYHQLGKVAEERRDFNAAELLYKQSLDIFERYQDEYSTSIVMASLDRCIIVARGVQSYE